MIGGSKMGRRKALPPDFDGNYTEEELKKRNAPKQNAAATKKSVRKGKKK